METGFSLGSNLGDRLTHLVAARRRICALPGVQELAVSPIYETDPVGVAPEYRHLAFLNAVLIVQAGLAPLDWRCATAQIEADLGRMRTADKFAPRTIDIDILYVGNQSFDAGGLIIPHPCWKTRRFVLQPLADVRPALVLPGSSESVVQALAKLPPGEAVRRYAAAW